MKMFAMLTALTLLVACSKKSGEDKVYTLTGKWKMTDQYIGNIPTGQWTHPPDPTYYRFTDTDSLIIDQGNLTFRLAIEKLSDSTFRTSTDMLLSTYKIRGNKLTIRNPCDEGCEWRFMRTY